jgi:aminoglycoside phosphotransferase (APT) family kinase protein
MHAQPSEPWAPDVIVDEELAATLIARDFPQFTGAEVARFGEGWDNVAFLVSGAYVFRFPRRVVSAKLVEREISVLPLIAGRLPLPITHPTLVGRPSSEYPWTYAGYAKLRGSVLSALRPEESDYAHLAGALGAFLRALHSIDCTPLLAGVLPLDEIGRFDYARTIDRLRARLNDLQVAGLCDDAGDVLAYAEGLAPIAPRPHGCTVVHGDLYARHILVGGALDPTGVIDWGDVHFGDPAVDLTVAYGVIPPSSRDEFFAAYGTIDDTARRLARYRAIYSCALIAHYGHRIADGDMMHIGLRGLRTARLA